MKVVGEVFSALDYKRAMRAKNGVGFVIHFPGVIQAFSNADAMA